MKNDFVDVGNSRAPDQTQVMNQIIANNECPFCLENLHKYHQDPTVKEGEYWIITPNRWPYENTQVHLLAIYKKHAVRLSELEPAAGAELFKLFAELEKENRYPGGGWAMRFGDTDYSAGTVNHLHAQFIIPDVEKEDFKPVRFKIGKDKEKRD